MLLTFKQLFTFIVTMVIVTLPAQTSTRSNITTHNLSPPLYPPSITYSNEIVNLYAFHKLLHSFYLTYHKTLFAKRASKHLNCILHSAVASRIQQEYSKYRYDRVWKSKMRLLIQNPYNSLSWKYLYIFLHGVLPGDYYYAMGEDFVINKRISENTNFLLSGVKEFVCNSQQHFCFIQPSKTTLFTYYLRQPAARTIIKYLVVFRPSRRTEFKFLRS